MDFEPWWLISVPVLFGLGWLAARIDFRQMLSESRTLPDSYFKGLNFLLNEEPDRAIDAFIEVAKLDPETTELHFALGSLFRRRGEMERAIRVHQSLLARGDLPVADREKATFELGQDFFKAGLFDRAKAAFERNLQTRYALDALRALIRIHEAEHDWVQALDAVQQLHARSQEPVPQRVHYHCEQAQAALDSKAPDQAAAEQALDRARAVLRDTPEATSASVARVHMLSARLAALREDHESEWQHLSTVLEVAPEYAGLIAARVLACHAARGTAGEGLARLRAQYAEHPTLDLFNAVFKALRAQEGAAPAWTFAREALHLHPSLLGLDRLLEVELAQEGAVGESARLAPPADLPLLRRLIHKHSARLDRYLCQQCGFEARRYYWQCPGCNGWETYRPLRLEEIR